MRFFLSLFSVIFTFILLEIFVRFFINDGMNYEIEMMKYAKDLKVISKNKKIGIEHKKNIEGTYMGAKVILDENGFSKMFDKNFFESRSQDLKKAYHDAGQFYLASSKTWLSKKNILEGCKPFILPRMLVQDIDSLEDWDNAEIIFDVIREQSKKN